MSNKNVEVKKQILEEKILSKKAAVLGKEKKKGKAIYIAVSLCALVITVVVVTLFARQGDSGSDFAQTHDVTYPLEMFNDGKAKHFQFQADNGITVKYFILKSSDGIVRAAFDACDVCWPSGKGYYQDGDYMICRNCGRRFVSIKVNEVKGGCNPAPLERKVVGDILVIEAANILEGRRYFDFAKRG